MEISLLAFLGICFYTDIKYKKIYLLPVLIWAVAGMGWMVYVSKGPIGIIALQGCIRLFPGFLMILIAVATKEAIGIGDGVVFAITGIYLGTYKNIQLILLSLLLCTIVSIFLLCFKKGKKKQKIAFIPFLLAGYMLILLIG